MKTAVIVIFLYITAIASAMGQSVFYGSLLLSFASATRENVDSPMLWNIETEKLGGKMGLEIQDEMLARGVSKRVVFNPADSTWTMLLSLNNIKQGSVVKRSAMFREQTSNQIFQVAKTGQKRIINGYLCSKIILESKNHIAEVWKTDKLNFDVCMIYKLLAHCGIVNDFFRQGDWFLWQAERGMILEATTSNKANGDNYSINVSSIKIGEVNESAFNMSGFKLSEIPEGQNCGIKIEEK